MLGFFLVSVRSRTRLRLLQPSESQQGCAAAQAAVPSTTDMRTRNQIDLNMIQSGPRAGVHFLLLENIIAVES